MQSRKPSMNCSHWTPSLNRWRSMSRTPLPKLLPQFLLDLFGESLHLVGILLYLVLFPMTFYGKLKLEFFLSINLIDTCLLAVTWWYHDITTRDRWHEDAILKHVGLCVLWQWIAVTGSVAQAYFVENYVRYCHVIALVTYYCGSWFCQINFK